MTLGEMQIEAFQFDVETATFRYITESWSGAGWDFSFHARCRDAACQAMFPEGALLRTEAAPLPLRQTEDYTGVEVAAALAYDDESGEPFFGLMVGEEHEVSHLQLKFLERDGERYLIEINAQVTPTVFGHSATLKLRAWTQQLPDHAYPT